MSKKNIGIIGIGDLTTNFFKCLIDSNVGRDVLPQTESFLFYDSRRSKSQLEISPKFIELERIVSGNGGPDLVNLSASESLKDFYHHSSLILFLAGGGYYSDNLKEGKIDSTSLFVFDRIKGLQRKGHFTRGKASDFSRIEEELPHNLTLMVDYAQILQPLTQLYAPKPIIMGPNEPSLCSSIVSSICPQLTDYIIGFTSVDLERLTEVFNDELRELKKIYGLENVTIKVGVKGNHDHQMIPELYVSDPVNQDKLEQLYANVNFQGMFDQMSQKLVNYWEEHNQERNLNEQVAVSLAQLTDSVLSSLGNALTPSDEMFNAVFHPAKHRYRGIKINSGEGLHFVNRHKVLNGRTILDNRESTDILAEREFAECQKDHYRLFADFVTEKSDPVIAQISGFPKSVESVKNQAQNGGRKFLVSQKRKVLLLKDNSYNFSQIAEFKTGLPSRSLNVMSLDNGSVEYLLAGHDRHISIENLNGSESRLVKVRLPNEKQGCFNNVAKLDDKLVASHRCFGLLNFNLEEFYDGDVIIDKSNVAKYFMAEHFNGVNTSHSFDEDNFFVVDNNRVICYDSELKIKESWTFPEVISSLSYNGQNLFAGTVDGKVFSNDNLSEPMIDIGYQSSITNLDSNNQYIVFNTFDNCPGSLAYFGQLGTENVEDSLAGFELYASWLGLRDNFLYANQHLGSKFVKKDLSSGDDVIEIYVPKMGAESCIID